MNNIFVIPANWHKSLQLARTIGWEAQDCSTPSTISAVCVTFATGVTFWTLVCTRKVGADGTLVVLAWAVWTEEAWSAVYSQPAVQVIVQRGGGRCGGGCRCSKSGGCGRRLARFVAIRTLHRCRLEAFATSRHEWRAHRSARAAWTCGAFSLVAKHCVVKFGGGCA